MSDFHTHHAVSTFHDEFTLCGKPVYRTGCIGLEPARWDNHGSHPSQNFCPECENLVTLEALKHA